MIHHPTTAAGCFTFASEGNKRKGPSQEPPTVGPFPEGREICGLFHFQKNKRFIHLPIERSACQTVSDLRNAPVTFCYRTSYRKNARFSPSEQCPPALRYTGASPEISCTQRYGGLVNWQLGLDIVALKTNGRITQNNRPVNHFSFCVL